VSESSPRQTEVPPQLDLFRPVDRSTLQQRAVPINQCLSGYLS